MKIAYCPHIATLKVKTDVMSGIKVINSTWTTSSGIAGMIDRASAQHAQEFYGVDCALPAVFLSNTAICAGVKVGDRLTVNTRTYNVLARPVIFDAISPLHYELLLEEVSN